MLAAYKAAVPLKRTETNTNIMDASDTHNRAAEFLGHYYVRKQNWAEALKYWEAWHPASWCGTCQASMEQTKQRNRVQCLLQLGRHQEAAQGALESVLGDGWSASPALAGVLVKLYDQAAQRKDLLQMIEDSDRKKLKAMRSQEYARNQSDAQLLSGLATRGVREQLQIQDLAAKKQFQQLIEICAKSGSPIWQEPRSGWQGRAAAEALANAQGDAILALRQALKRNDANVNRSWLIYALGRSRSPQALPILQELVRARAKEQYPDNAENLIYAIWLKGEAGQAALKQIAGEKESGIAYYAEKWLKTPEATELPFPESAAPKRGTLPRTYRSSEVPE
jgi:hypothetical protein